MSTENVAAGTVSAEGVTTEADRVFHDRDAFMTIWEQCIADGSGPAGVAKIVKRDKNTVLTRASKCRSEGFELSYAKKGGGAKLDKQKSLELLAAAKGITLEQLQEQAAQGAAKRAERKAAKAAKASTPAA